MGRERSEPILELVNGAPVGGREVGFGGEAGRVGVGRGLSGWVASESSVVMRQPPCLAVRTC